MNIDKNIKHRLERSLLECTDLYRGFIMDLVEQELGDQKNWQFIRGRLLKAMGDRGLSGRIREILGDELGEGGGEQ